MAKHIQPGNDPLDPDNVPTYGQWTLVNGKLASLNTLMTAGSSLMTAIRNLINALPPPVTGLIVDGKIKLYGLSGKDYDNIPIPGNLTYGVRFDGSDYPHPPKIELTYYLPQQVFKNPLYPKNPLGQLV
jgi:hypothetical protein